jgi:Na+-driven multidrug efflux pump
MVDLGMVTAAGNRITMAMGSDDACEANRIFQSAQAFIVIIFIVFALLIIPSVLFSPLPWFENIDESFRLIPNSWLRYPAEWIGSIYNENL